MTSTHKTGRCRACFSVDLVEALDLGQQQLSKFVDPGSAEEMEAYPLDLLLCRQCGLVQLASEVPPHLLYGDDYGYRSGISETIKSDLKSIVESAIKFRPVENVDTVVDIGCNDGTLLEQYPSGLARVGFDPLSKFESEVTSKGIAFINDYFNAGAFKNRFADRKAQIITAISMFYDLEDPNQFLEDIRTILDPAGILVIQQNYLVAMIENNAFDNICHEHIEYYSLSSLKALLERHGLTVFNVALNDTNGGSIRTFICHTGSREPDDTVRLCIESEPDIFDPGYYHAFQSRIESIRSKVVKFMRDETKGGKKFYALGASTRGNTLLQYFDIDRTLLAGAMERNAEKYGKLIASVGIPIVSEEDGRAVNPDYFLVLPWHFKDQIVSRESEYLSHGGTLLFPLPEPVLVSKSGETPLK